MTNREAMEFASKNSFLALYEKGRADAFEDACDRIEEGVCHICEFYDMDAKCVNSCSSNNRELDAFIKWLKEQK